MNSRTNYTIVGGFVIILGIAFIWGILWISSGGSTQRFDRYLVYVTESVAGLQADAPLDFMGVNVGKVEAISIDPDNPERVRLLLQVQQGTPVNQDTVATLVFQSLTGTGSVSLTGGEADSPPLQKTPGEEYPVIASQPSLTSRLNTAAPALLSNLTETTDSINALLNEENRGDLARTLRNIATLTDQLAQQSDQLDTAFEQVGAILQNARIASDKLPAMFEDLSASAKGLTQMSDQVRMVGDSAAAVIGGFEHVIATSEEGLTYFTSTTLPDISAMIAELRAASENLRRASEKLERNPSVLIYGETTVQPGPGE